MSYTISRQIQWPDGDHVVEISKGGLDYANPDALCRRYPGELETFDDPREAVETAIAVARAWQADEDRRPEPGRILIGMGGTGGMTMPFDGEPLVEATFAGLREHANQVYERLPKCDGCGDLIKDEVRLTDYDTGFAFCSVYCAEEWLRHERAASAAEDEEE